MAMPKNTLVDTVAPYRAAEVVFERGLRDLDSLWLEEELADVLIYLVRLADVLGVKLTDATEQKLLANERRYPPSKVTVKAIKYTELDEP